MISFRKFITGAAVVALMASMTSCKSMFRIPSDVDVPLVMPNTSVPNTYRNVDKAVRIDVQSSVTPDDMYNDDVLSKAMRRYMANYHFVPSIPIFAKEATTSYMQKMRFDVNSTADYCLKIDVTRLQLSWTSKKSANATASISYRLIDEAGEALIHTSYASATVELAGAEQFGNGMGRAYAAALAKMDWDRIADCLTIARSAKQEKNAQVQGNGDTALEHTVIRWYITSAPQGADVSWRVVSSTPDVANTNSNFVGTTPYETTESFDIKGMTYNNSGNVQIEVTCERPGYLPQKKRFNLKQAIDQKEISAKFNLVKDE